MLLAKGHKVRALVCREDEQAENLRRLGAEVMVGDLTDLAWMRRAIEGCSRIYFGMSISAAYRADEQVRLRRTPRWRIHSW